MDWYFDRERVGSLASVIDRFSDGAFASPFRSTVPLIQLAQHASDLLLVIAAECGADPDATAHVEYCADNPAGGRPSQTDLMLLGPSRALAVEAKWTEPRYETVALRLSRGDTSNRAAGRGSGESANERTVRGWLEVLQPYARGDLTLDAAASLVYQVVHRAASACRTGQRPALAYVHFHSEVASAATTDQYVTDLQALHSFMGEPLEFPMTVVEVPVGPTQQFAEIAALRKGSPKTDVTVRRALKDSLLLEFGEPKFIRVA